MELKKLKKWLVLHEKLALWGPLCLYIGLFSLISLWKYAIFAYNGIDLAYFSQVFWNSLHGHFFAQSIHPHLSLGDHAELVIPLLLPFYALFADPRTLLVLQTAALALAAWPLFLLAKQRLGGDRLASLFIAWSFLASPLVQNINLFEFHILPFALLPLFFMLLAYEEKRLGRFAGFAALTMLVREDVSLVVAAVSLLAWAEGRSWRWRALPLSLGAAWFAAAMQLIGRFAPDGGYKFAVYYSWLPEALGEPARIMKHFFTLPNFEMFLGFALPALFLPYLRPRRLLLALGPLAQILLGAPGGGSIVLETHYATLFLPGLFLAATDGLAAAPELVKKYLPEAIMVAPTRRNFLFALLGASAIYGMLSLGPLPAVARRLARPSNDAVRAAAGRKIVARIPAQSSVAAGYALLPHLASREKLYSLHYGYLGVTQFASAAYRIPDDVAFAVMDAADFSAYQAQFSKTAWSRPYAAGGEARLEPLLGSLVAASDTFVAFRNDGAGDAGENMNFLSNIGATAFSAARRFDSGRQTLSLAFDWPETFSPADNLVVTVAVSRKDNAVIARSLPLIATTKKLVWEFPLGDLSPGEYMTAVTVAAEEAEMNISGIRSIERRVTGRRELGSALLPPFRIE